MSGRRRSYVGAILAILAGLSVWPYLRTVGFEPMAFDDAVWISRSVWGRPDWWEWVARTRQLGVGYRPITALSFTLDAAVAGFRMPVYRCTDLLLHVAAGILVFALFRRLARDASGWASLLAAGVFLLHPAAEEVVPFLARRSYSLATVFGLGAVVLSFDALREDRGERRLVFRAGCAAILLGLGVLSNETAVAFLPVAVVAMALAADAWRPGWRSWALALAPPATTTIGILILRSHVVAGLGGYETPVGGAAPFTSVFLASWRDLAAFRMTFGGTPPAFPPWRVGLLVVVASYYLARVGTAVARPDSWRRPPLFVLAFGWLAGCSVLYAALGVWFPREAYTMLPALALGLPSCLIDGLRAHRARPRLLAIHLLPQIAFLAMLLANSPAVRGPQPTRMENWAETERLLLRLRADLPAVPPRSEVHLVFPYRERLTRFNPLWPGAGRKEPPPYFVRLPSRWLSTLFAPRGLGVENFLFVRKEDLAERFRIVQVDAGPALMVSHDETYFERTAGGLARRVARAGEAVPLTPPPEAPGVGSYVYVWDDQGGRLIEIARGG